MTVGSDVKSCYVSIKSAEANLEKLSLSSTSKENSKVYEDARQLLEEVQKELHEQVLFLAREEPQYK